MDTGLTIAVILAMIALGAFVIHRLNGQQAERTALHLYSRRPTRRHSTRSPTREQSDIAPPPPVRARRDHRGGGRGRLRPRRKASGAAKGRRT